MSRLPGYEYLLFNLEEAFEAHEEEYMPRDAAYALLKDVTQQDFGLDAKQWRKWIEAEVERGASLAIECYSAWQAWKELHRSEDSGTDH